MGSSSNRRQVIDKADETRWYSLISLALIRDGIVYKDDERSRTMFLKAWERHWRNRLQISNE